MAQPPASGNGQGEQPDRDAGLPGGLSGRGRDPRLGGFARGGAWDVCSPSGRLAAVVEEVSGPEWRCPGASDDELVGLLRRWEALESWAAAGKLGVVREMLRRDDAAGGNKHGDLPDGVSESLQHELAAALGVSTRSAENTVWLAFELQARLPGIGALLANGTLTLSKARTATEELAMLTDTDAERAEALILDQLAGKTHGQIGRLAARAAAEVDPETAEKRRKHAEEHDARVRLWREQSGAVGLAGHGLPTDEALAAYANVNARAQEYKKSGAFPDAKMDQIRVMAYLDLLNDVSADTRIANAVAKAGAEVGPEPAPSSRSEPEPGDDAGTAAGPGGNACDCNGPGGDGPGNGPGDDGPGDNGPGGVGGFGPGGPGPGGPGGDSGPGSGALGDGGPGVGDPDDDDDPGCCERGPADAAPDRRSAASAGVTDLVTPLMTLLGLAERPGESHGLGPLDPSLARELAAAAANYVGSQWCITVTDPHGFAIGHGCARPGNPARPGNIIRPGNPASPGYRKSEGGSLAALPARVNLTIPLTVLQDLMTRQGRAGPGTAAWSFTRCDESGPPDAYGTWTLILPDCRDLGVKLGPVPTFECDHRHESHAYQPNDTLRHLVQVRDGTCTFPPCSRHARESDFEHAVPYDKGGRTCSCNAGARSRKCHRVKQSPGWSVTQPRPGWHQWTTPAGRVYTQEPKRYPA